MGGGYRGHMHRESQSSFYSHATGKIVEAADEGTSNVKAKSQLMNAIY